MDVPSFVVKNKSLHVLGKKAVSIAKERMPALLELKKRFKKEKPLKGLTIGMLMHVTKEAAVLVETLVEGGAKVALACSNPLTTQDHVAAYLAETGINVYAYKGESEADYYRFIDFVLNHKPNIVIDDGGDLITTIHTKHKELLEQLKGGTEETTTGVLRLRNMEAEQALKIPVIAVNDNKTKNMFDNYYGTGQSTIDGILRAINPLIAGKTVVVVGYGACGKGIAERAKGLGAKVVVCEVNAIKALQAFYDGFNVMPMQKAAKIGDIFITVTGNKKVITMEHVKLMKKGAVLANSGHFDVEIDVKGIKENADAIERINANTERITINEKHVYLLSEGRLVNLIAGEGHPSEVMDTSFCGQALAVEYVATHKLIPGVYKLPDELDYHIAELKLKTLGVEIDMLSKEQEEYLKEWHEGT